MLQAWFHAKATALSEVEGQWSSVQPPGNPRSRTDEVGMPATGPQALITTCTPILRQGTAEHYPNNPVSSAPQSQTVTLLTLTKVARSPLVWVNRNPSLNIKKDLNFRFLVVGTLLSAQGTTAPDERGRLLSLLVPQHAIQH